MTLRRLVKSVGNEEYKITSHYYENDDYVYRHFIVTQEGTMICMYELGIKKEVLTKVSNHQAFDPQDKLYELGLKVILERITEKRFESTNEIITQINLDQKYIDWEKQLKKAQ